MIKRYFAMKCLNITQGRYNNYSHKNLNAYDLAGVDSGIDFFFAPCKLTIIGVYPYSTTGFANTVIFYDAENNVSIALTHMNKLPADYKVGKSFVPGEKIYEEGTIGKATGNHIHMELGKGRQTRKVKINSKEWGLKNWINIEDYFYVDPNFTTVKQTNGYSFNTVREEVIDEMVYFKVLKGTYTDKNSNKKAIPTRENETSNYDTNYPLLVGEIFGITGEPASVNGAPCYKIGYGSQVGRFVKFDSTDLKNGYFIMVTKP